MQMVGATKSFIRKPFIWQSVRLGIIGALVAIVGLIALIFYLDTKIPEIELLVDYEIIGIICAVIISLGILITWLSTFFATQRFLNLRTDEIYY
jgi:cell division transport system permease protein